MGRSHIPGGHDFRKDSGFSLMEPTDVAKATLRRMFDEHSEALLEWAEAAHHLSRASEQAVLAGGAGNQAVMREMQEAEIRYARARYAAQQIISSYYQRD
jgi:hypothetical protein